MSGEVRVIVDWTTGNESRFVEVETLGGKSISVEWDKDYPGNGVWSMKLATLTKPADAGVSDEDVDAACFASINRNAETMARHVRRDYAGQLMFREDIRCALESYASRHARQGEPCIYFRKDEYGVLAITPEEFADWGKDNSPEDAYSPAYALPAQPEQARQGEVVGYRWESLYRMENDSDPRWYTEMHKEPRWKNNDPETIRNVTLLYTHPPAQPEQAKAGDWDAVKLIADFIGTIGGDGYWHSEDDTNPLRMDMRKLSTQLTAALPTTKE